MARWKSFAFFFMRVQVCGEATAQELSGLGDLFGGKKWPIGWWFHSPSINCMISKCHFFLVFQFGKAHKKQGARVCNFLLSIGSSEVPFNPRYLEPILAWWNMIQKCIEKECWIVSDWRGIVRDTAQQICYIGKESEWVSPCLSNKYPWYVSFFVFLQWSWCHGQTHILCIYHGDIAETKHLPKVGSFWVRGILGNPTFHMARVNIFWKFLESIFRFFGTFLKLWDSMCLRHGRALSWFPWFPFPPQALLGPLARLS